MISIADLQAIGDVLDQLANEAHDMAPEQALPLKRAGEVVQQKLKLALEELNTVTLSGLEQPRRIGDQVVAAVISGKWRPDQAKIKQLVASRAQYDRDGQTVYELTTIAENAVDLMYELFVQPSAMPKQGALDRLGIDKRDIARWEMTGKKLKTMTLADEEP